MIGNTCSWQEIEGYQHLPPARSYECETNEFPSCKFSFNGNNSLTRFESLVVCTGSRG